MTFPKRCWLNQTKEDGTTFNEQSLRIDERFWAVFQNCAANFDGGIREQEEVSLVSVNRRGGDHVDRNRWDGKPCRGNQKAHVQLRKQASQVLSKAVAEKRKSQAVK